MAEEENLELNELEPAASPAPEADGGMAADDEAGRPHGASDLEAVDHEMVAMQRRAAIERARGAVGVHRVAVAVGVTAAPGDESAHLGGAAVGLRLGMLAQPRRVDVARPRGIGGRGAGDPGRLGAAREATPALVAAWLGA